MNAKKRLFLLGTKSFWTKSLESQLEPFPGIRAPCGLTSVQAGKWKRFTRSQPQMFTGSTWSALKVRLTFCQWVCYISYSVNSIMNPILVACLGLGCFFICIRQATSPRGGVIMSHPTPWEFHPIITPATDFFEVLADGTDPEVIEHKYEQVCGG